MRTVSKTDMSVKSVEDKVVKVCEGKELAVK